jgi:hypothetical protein
MSGELGSVVTAAERGAARVGLSTSSLLNEVADGKLLAWIRVRY